MFERVGWILGVVKLLAGRRDRQRKVRVSGLKTRLLRNFENGQGHRDIHGAYSASLKHLEQDGVFSEAEREDARTALTELCDAGMLDYQDGRYYLAGRAPRVP